MDLYLIGKIIGGIAVIGGIIYAWREGYIDWDRIKESLGIEGIKEMFLSLFTEPLFILLYLIFVLVPIWYFGKYIAQDLPVYYKILCSIGGIWAVNQIMIARDLR